MRFVFDVYGILHCVFQLSYVQNVVDVVSMVALHMLFTAIGGRCVYINNWKMDCSFLSISVCVRSLLFDGVHKIIKINYCFCDRENNMCRCGFVRLGVYKYKHSAVRFEQCFKNKTADLVCNDGYFDLRSTICSLECISVCVYLCRPSWLF